MAAADSGFGSLLQSVSKAFQGSTEPAMHTISLKPFVQNQQLEDLLMWRNPTKSGVLFGSISLAYFVLVLSGLSFFFIVSNVLMIGVLTMFVWHHFGKALKYPAPELPAFLSSGLTEKEIKEFCDKYLARINQVLLIVYSLATGSDVLLTGKTVGALFLVGRLSSVMSPFTLAYFVVFVAFTAPKLYEMRKDEVDAALVKASDYIKQGVEMFNSKVMSKIPTAKKTE